MVINKKINALFDQSLMLNQEKGVVKKKCESGVGVIEGRAYSMRDIL